MFDYVRHVISGLFDSFWTISTSSLWYLITWILTIYENIRNMISTNIRDIDIAGGTHIPVPGAKELLSTQVTMQGSGKEGVPPFSVSSSLALFSLSDGK